MTLLKDRVRKVALVGAAGGTLFLSQHLLKPAYGAEWPIKLAWDHPGGSPNKFGIYYAKMACGASPCDPEPLFVSPNCGQSPDGVMRCYGQTPAVDQSRYVWQVYVTTIEGTNESIPSNTISSVLSAGPKPPKLPNLVVDNYMQITKDPCMLITGSFSTDNMAKLYVNGQWITSTPGNFGTTVCFQKGSNIVTAELVDVFGSKVTNIGNVTYDPDAPLVQNVAFYNPSDLGASGIGPAIAFNVADISHKETNVYLNGNFVKKIDSLPADGKIVIGKELPLEYLVDGNNHVQIVSSDRAGNVTSLDQYMDLILQGDVLEGAERLTPANVATTWKWLTGSKGGQNAKISTSIDDVVEGKQAVDFPLTGTLSQNQYIGWTKKFDVPININYYTRLEAALNYTGNDGELERKWEFRDAIGNYAYVTAPLKKGKNTTVDQIETLKKSGAVDTNNITEVRTTYWRRLATPITFPTGAKVALDGFVGYRKIFVENGDEHETDAQLQAKWVNKSYPRTLNAVLTTDLLSVTEGIKAVKYPIVGQIDPNKCVIYDWSLAEKVDLTRFIGMGMDYNNGTVGIMAPKVEFWSGASNLYYSSLGLPKGRTNIRVPFSSLKVSGTPDSTQIEAIRLAIFNRGTSALTANPANYGAVDNFYFEPSKFFHLPK